MNPPAVIVPVVVSLASFFRNASSTLNAPPLKVRLVPPVYVVFVSVDAIVTSPPLSVMVIFEPAIKSKSSESAPRVLPPAVIVLHVFVSVLVV